jgi:hypothetical protein
VIFGIGTKRICLDGSHTSAWGATRTSPPNANDLYLDVATSEDFGLSVTAESGRPTEFKPAKAIASIPTAMIKPKMAFALSHRLNSR